MSLPAQCNPTLACRGLFGSVLSAEARQEFALRSNVLDFMADDVKRAPQRLIIRVVTNGHLF